MSVKQRRVSDVKASIKSGYNVLVAAKLDNLGVALFPVAAQDAIDKIAVFANDQDFIFAEISHHEQIVILG